MEYKIIDKICKNPWCRAPYKVKLEVEEEEVIDISEVDESNLNDSINDLLNDIKSNRKKEKEVEQKKQDIPKTCPKCRSFDNELSGGVSWQEKKYSGPRQDGKAHGVGFRFSEYRHGKGFWNR